MEEFHIPVNIKPLFVEIDGIGKYRQASTVDDLTSFLLGGTWPQGEKTNPKFRRALVTSIEAMEWYVDAESARAAFVEAAHAAGMHVLPDDKQEVKQAS